MDERFLVASRIDPSKLIDPSGIPGDEIQFYPIEAYAPDGTYAVDDAVFREMLTYRYKWAKAGFALIPKGQLKTVETALLVDVIGRVSYLQSKAVPEDGPTLKEILVGEAEDAEPAEDAVAPENTSTMLECPECGRKGFNERTLKLHAKREHSKEK